MKGPTPGFPAPSVTEPVKVSPTVAPGEPLTSATVTSNDVPLVALSVIAPAVAPPLVTTSKSSADNPVTGSSNVTRKTRSVLLPTCWSTKARLMAATVGTIVSMV